jgi:peptide/nickel transport system permease protein
MSTIPLQPPLQQPRGVLATAGEWLTADRRRLVATILFMALLLVAFVGPYLTPHDPIRINPRARFLAPDSVYWFGTDRFGWDIFSRAIQAARTNLLIALGSVLLSIGIGVPIGVLVGYFGGRLDGVVMRLFDVFQAFPALVLAIAVLAVLGSGALNIALVIGLIGVPTYVRLVRGEVRVIRELPYVEAARSVGCGAPRLILRYILPGTLGTVMVQAATSCGWALILTAGLGFLGLGPKVPYPEWGYMISTGAEDMVVGYWWTSFFPGLMIVFAVFVFNLLGEVLADAVDPRRSAPR